MILCIFILSRIKLLFKPKQTRLLSRQNKTKNKQKTHRVLSRQKQQQQQQQKTHKKQQPWKGVVCVCGGGGGGTTKKPGNNIKEQCPLRNSCREQPEATDHPTHDSVRAQRHRLFVFAQLLGSHDMLAPVSMLLYVHRDHKDC